MVQLDGLNELFSNAPATDRNVLAEFILTEIKTKHLEKVGDLHAHRNALLPQGVSLILTSDLNLLSVRTHGECLWCSIRPRPQCSNQYKSFKYGGAHRNLGTGTQSPV